MTSTAAPATPTIAVVGAEPLRDELESLGFATIGGSDATAPETVGQAISRQEVFRLIVADLGETQPARNRVQALLPFAQQRSVPSVHIHTAHADGHQLESFGAATLSDPCTLNDILRAIGYQDAGGKGAHSIEIPAPPSAASSPLPLPLPAIQTGTVAAQPADAERRAAEQRKLEMEWQQAEAEQRRQAEQRKLEMERQQAEAEQHQQATQPSAYDAIYNRHRNTAAASGYLTKPATVIIVHAAKGGVSKTTTSFSLALAAAEQTDQRVLLIDGNRGQGGIRALLRIPESRTKVPSIGHLAYRGAQPEHVIVDPDTLNRERPQLPPVRFSAVLAPPAERAEEDNTPYGYYQRVLEYARSRFDLIIVDTQTFDAEIGTLFKHVWLPALRSGAWGVCLTDPSTESFEGTMTMFDTLRKAGINPTRQLLIGSLWSPADPPTDELAAGLKRAAAPFANFIGFTFRDDRMAQLLPTGVVDINNDAVRPILRRILHIVTGDDRYEGDVQTSTRQRRWFLPRRRR